jgi:hypothetical protein
VFQSGAQLKNPQLHQNHRPPCITITTIDNMWQTACGGHHTLTSESFISQQQQCMNLLSAIVATAMMTGS